MSLRLTTVATTRSLSGIFRNNGVIASKRFSSNRRPVVIRHRGKATDATSNANAKSSSPAESTAAPATKTAVESSSSSDGVPLGKTVVAMTLAIATVSTAANIAENATASTVPKFDPKSQRFDQSTFMGRLSKMLLACDPTLLFKSGAEVQRCKELVEDWKNQMNNLPEGMTETEMSRKLWEAQRVAGAALHPDTGDTIPLPFRMSGYVPFNGPICVAMVASQSTSALLFWSWVNQSQNALVNYYNRNASSEMTNETLMKSYAAAVGSALTVAFGLATFIQKRYSPEQAKNLMRWVSFPSAVVASSLNCYIVRSPEIDTGIPLVDRDGDEILPGETSKIAAERGVNSTTFSRALLQAPVYFFPPLLMSSIPIIKNVVERNPALRVPMTTYLLLCCFGLGLPASVAIFPQMGEIKVSEAEEKYQKISDKSGKGYEVLFYNKGL
mmetsp:Transcript_12183/g.24873  ORF Transcript_12183/g.24873 Transcript_12183/m.24873 type:complete len:442 (+) Transcript_12183:55-1380(+)